eukprot:6479042-Amphidinium_carterae.1
MLACRCMVLSPLRRSSGGGVLLELVNGRPHGPVRHRQLWVGAMRRGEPISGGSQIQLSPRDLGATSPEAEPRET